jgi:hypothetical protein
MTDQGAALSTATLIFPLLSSLSLAPSVVAPTAAGGPAAVAGRRCKRRWPAVDARASDGGDALQRWASTAAARSMGGPGTTARSARSA